MRQLVLELLHLVAWGQLGVLIRYYLGRVFGGACKPDGGSWVPCVTSPGLSRTGGALFIDLPANILGSALMGLLSPADLLLMRPGAPAAPPPPQQQPARAAVDGVAAAADKQPPPTPAPPPAGGAVQAGVPCACLPRHSPLQQHSALLLGLRTGLCGCLTTFASWLNQMVEMMVGTSPSTRDAGTEWFEAVCGLILGSLASQAALNFGQQLAFMLAGHWHQHSQHRQQHKQQSAAASAPPLEVALAVPESVQRAPVQVQVVLDGTQIGSAAHHGTSLLTKGAAPTHGAPGKHEAATAAAQGGQAVAEACWDGGGEAAAEGAQGKGGWCGGAQGVCALADAWAGVMVLVLSGVSVALIAVVTTADVREDAPGNKDFALWVAILLGPIGCLTRWKLSVLNTRPPSPAGAAPLFPPAWFPLGTWCANMGGCLLDYIMTLLQLRVRALGPNSNGVLTAVMLGVGGSLSTVSTWVVELQKLGLQAQANHRATWYYLGSLVPAVALGILVYGTAVWTL